jgi:hypothetical protein
MIRSRPELGPDGETCGTCRHLIERADPAGTLFRCGVAARLNTKGRGAGVLATAPACPKWQGCASGRSPL